MTYFLLTDDDISSLQYPNTTLTAWLGLLENFKEEGTLHSKFAGDIKNETVVTLQEQRNHVKESVKRVSFTFTFTLTSVGYLTMYYRNIALLYRLELIIIAKKL